MIRKSVSMLVFLFLLCNLSFAQDWMPDPNLQKAVRESLELNDNEPLTPKSMEKLEYLNIARREITNITGLEFAVNLKELVMWGNPIQDISPLANLKLQILDAGGCQIADISPLSNILTLEYLHLHWNRIHDITPILNLKNLKELSLLHNPISDYTIIDQTLNLEYRDWGAICELPDMPVADRIENKSNPAIFSAWSDILDRPNLSHLEKLAEFDLAFCCPYFDLSWIMTPQGWKLSGDIEYAKKQRNELLQKNPNTLLLVEIPYYTLKSTTHPLYDDFYLRRPDGTPKIDGTTFEEVISQGGVFNYLLDFTIPELQDIVVQHAIAVAQCGLYDGIIFDHWNEWPRLTNTHTIDEEHTARTTILKRIRESVNDEFLIIANTNWQTIPKWSEYINGAFMELPEQSDEYGYTTLKDVILFENVLTWSEENMRYPQINSLEGRGIITEPHDSLSNLKWMRLFTTMGLTHSNGLKCHRLFRPQFSKVKTSFVSQIRQV